MNLETLIDLCYLIASVLFIYGLKGLTHPRTAVRGNLIGAAGMLLAIVATLFHPDIADSGFFHAYGLVLIGVLMGTGIGVALALLVRMTSMPQMVALLNGFGGGASVLVAGGYLITLSLVDRTNGILIATAASGLIGGVTFSGSLIAFAKLQELQFVKDLRFSGMHAINGGVGALCLLFCVLLVIDPGHGSIYYWILALVSLALGVFLVVGIGGADMPVVIALLNSYSGLAAAATGFVLGNTVLIIAGSLVGASGIILTKVMCEGMNRSLVNVLFGTLAPKGESRSADDVYANVKSTSAEEVAMMLDVAERVVIIPGYGMAVAQAQHAVRDLANALIERDIDVQFGIHPVAGRMPGHMNVLLAEANIDYDRMQEMDNINRLLPRTDVAIVLGANDVVNPDARTDPNSPIAGMPIIDADKARSVVVIKRSLSPGFAGIPNPLFAADNTVMLFGDGREMVVEILRAIQEG